MTLPRMIRAAALALTGFIAAALVMEIGLRLIAATPLWRVLPVVEVSLYGPDADAGYVHRAGVQGIWRSENRAHVAINQQNFRGPALSLPKPAGETRIAVVGDSFVEALQVEQPQTFTALAEQRLRQDTGRDLRVANFGLAGATPAVQRERLAGRVAALSPDIVVLMTGLDDFFGASANDDSAFPAWLATPDGGLALRHGFRDTRGYRFRTSTAGEAFYWLLDHVQLVGLLNNRKNAGFLPPATVPPAAPRDACADATETWQSYLQPGKALGWQRAEAYMRDAVALGRQHGFAPMLMLRGLTLTADCGAARSAHAAVLTRLHALAARTGLPLHDLNGLAIARLPAGMPLSDLHGFGAHTGAGHLNPRGHEIYAAVLAAAVQPLLP